MDNIKQEAFTPSFSDDGPLKWKDSMFIETYPEPVKIFPYPQTGTINRTIVYNKSGDTSQSFQVRFRPRTGPDNVTQVYSLNNDNLIYTAFIGFAEDLFWEYVIEGDVELLYYGGYMVSAQNVSRTTANSYGLITQLYFASMITTPTDGVKKIIQPQYTLSRPVNYTSQIGFDIGGTSNKRPGTFYLGINTLTIYDNLYPTATFQVQMSKKNSQTNEQNLGYYPISNGTTTLILYGQFPNQIESFDYNLDIFVNNGGTLIQNRFQRINLPVYMGAAIHAARMSGKEGTTFNVTASDTSRLAILQFRVMYDDSNEIIPDNSSQTEPYVKLFLKPVLTNQGARSFRASAFVNYENGTPFYRLCTYKQIESNSLIPLSTGGKSETGYQFSVSAATNMISASSPLRINVTQYADDNTAAISTLLTSLKTNTSLSNLIGAAVLTPNILTSAPGYTFTCGNSLEAASLGLTLTFEIQAMYVIYIPPPPPPVPVTNIESILPIQEAAIEEGEEILKNHGRDLTSTQLFDEPMKFALENYLKTDEPTEVQKSKAFTYFEPGQLETFERAKEQAWAFMKNDARGYQESSPEQFAQLLNEQRDNRFFKTNYPDLMRVANPQKGVAGFMDLVKEFYPGATQMYDIFAAPKILTRAPYYQSLTDKDKMFDPKHYNIFGSIMDTLGQTSKIESAQKAIAEDFLLAQSSPDYMWQKIQNPDKLPELFYYSFGGPYGMWNETQSQMQDSLRNPRNNDIFIPSRKNYGNEPTAITNAREWYSDRFSLEHLALITANYAWEKNKYDNKYFEKMNKNGTTAGFINNLIKDTLYNVDPLTKEASFFAKATVQAEGQKLLFNQIKDILGGFSLDSLIASVTSKPKIKPFVRISQIPQDVQDNEAQRMKQLQKKFPQYYELPSNVSPNVFFTPYDASKPDPYAQYRYVISDMLKKDPSIPSADIFKELSDNAFMESLYYDIGSPDWHQRIREQKNLMRIADDYSDFLPIFETAPSMDYMPKQARKFPKYKKRYNQGSHEYINRMASKILKGLVNIIPFGNEVNSIIDQISNLTFSGFASDSKKIAELNKEIYRKSDQARYDFEQYTNPRYYNYDPLFVRMKEAGNLLQKAYEYFQPKPSVKFDNLYNKDSSQRNWNTFKNFVLNEIARSGTQISKNLNSPEPYTVLRSAKNLGKRFSSYSASNPVNEMQRIYNDTAPINDTFSTNFSLPVNDTFLTNFSLPVNDTLPANLSFPVNDTFPANFSLPVNDTLPLNRIIRGDPVNTQIIADYGYERVPLDQQLILMEDFKRMQEQTKTKVKRKNKFTQKVVDGVNKVYNTMKENPKTTAGAAAFLLSLAYLYGTSSADSAPEAQPDDKVIPLLKQEVEVQKAEENSVGEVLVNNIANDAFKSREDANAFIDSDQTKDVDGRFQNMHAVSKFTEVLQKMVGRSSRLQHYVKKGLGQMFVKQALRQSFKGNLKGEAYFKVLKSIVDPEKTYEWELQQVFFSYFLTKPLYNAQDSIRKDNGEPLIDGFKQIMESPGPAFDFIERLIKSKTSNAVAFNGSLYSSQERPTYNIPVVTRVRPILSDLKLRQVQRIKR